MKKIAITTLVCALFTALCTGTMLTASAGINPNSPIGDGLLADGQLNVASFQAMDDTSSALSIQASDLSIKYNSGEWQEMLVGTPVSKEDMAKQDAKAILTYKFTQFPATGAQLMLTPGSSLTDMFTYGYVLTGGDNGVAVVDAYRTSKQDTDPVSKLIAHHGGNVEYPLPVQWQGYSWSGGTMGTHATTHGAAYFRMELTVNDNDWLDVKLLEGPLQNGAFQWRAGGATITNWAPYDGTTDLYPNCWIRYADGVVLDGATLEVSYTDGGETKTETVFETNMDDKATVISEEGAEAKAGCFMARGLEHLPLARAEVIVTNPAEDMRIVSLNPLKVDTRMDTTFEMTVDYRIAALASTRKIGIAFGLDNYRQKLSSPANGASLLYFTAGEDGATKLGAVNIAADGTATAAGTEATLEYTIGSGEYLTLSIVGNPDNSITVTVNGAEEGYTFPNFKLDGSIAFAQIGTGDATYGIATDSFTVTGYRFTENEGGAASATFDGNFISEEKFYFQSITTGVDSYMTANDNADHGLVGMVADGGKLGFYGTTTNTRIIFKEQYADFVMQFDYISDLFNKRGILPAERAFSPLYMMFGGESSSSSFHEFYTIGIMEGNPGTLYGAESLVLANDAQGGFGVHVEVLANRKAIDAPTEECITITKSDGTKTYYEPDPIKYSFYNKTTRVKLVVCNNRAEVYVAEVDPATNGIKGDYILAFTDTAKGGNGTFGSVGLATDAPGWATVDNLSITPIPTDKAIAAGYGKALGANLMPDVAVSDMENDVEPTRLPQPVLTVDTTAKKVTWEAVEGAKEYEVTVKKDGETVIEKTTVTTTEFSLATLTAEGDYEVAVSAIPENEAIHLASRATVTYTVAAQGGTTPGGDQPGGNTPGGTTPGGDDNPGGGGEEEEKGCGGIVGTSVIALFAVVTVAGALVLVAKRKEN